MTSRPKLSRRALLRGAAFLAGGASVAPGAEDAPPNIVLIVVDDLGWMDLGCQGGEAYQTPHIDRLAARGVRFTDAYANCPVCSPSRAALMTGKFPGRVGFTGHITAIGRHRFPPSGRILPPDDHMDLPHEETTVAEALGRRGYVSASIGKWHLGGPEFYPERHGFDRNVAGYDHGSPPDYFFPYEKPGQEWNSAIPTLSGGEPGEYLTDRLTAEAVRFLEGARDRPFFLYLPHYAVHTPLQAPAELIAKYERRFAAGPAQKSPVYAAMVEAVDTGVGRIVDALARLDLERNTVVIVTSDNGGESRATDNRPLREGKGHLYEGGLRVPLIIAGWPGGASGALCDVPVTGADLYPTIATLAGVPAGDESDQRDGVDLGPLLREPAAMLERDLVWYYPHYSPQARNPGAAIRSGSFKLIEHYDPPRTELFDLSEDLSERRDLADELPETTRELRGRLRAWIEANVGVPHRINPRYDPEWRARGETPR